MLLRVLVLALTSICVWEIQCGGTADDFMWGNSKLPEKCDEKNPSPVDLSGGSTGEEKVSDLVFTGLELEYKNIKCHRHKNAEIVQCDLTTLLKPFVTGGGLAEKFNYDAEERFYVHSIHFHSQSEHSFNGKRYPLEMHLVCCSAEYNDIKTAVIQGKLVIIAVLFEMSNDASGNNIHDIVALQGSKELNSQLESIVLLPTGVDSYFVYKGSITKPACSEEATWIVFKDFVQMAPSEVTKGLKGANDTLPPKPKDGQSVKKYVGRIKTQNAEVVRSAGGAGAQPMVIWVSILSCLILLRNVF